MLLHHKSLSSSIARDDPVYWIESLGHPVWSKQRDIINSVATNRRTAVKSAHTTGKSFVTARIVLWWLFSHPLGESFVITSAPSAAQVRAVLWREIGRAHAKAKLSGRANQTELWMSMPAGNEELVAFGRKPSHLDPSSFHGIHAKYVLVCFDEAGGIPAPLWNAADTLISNQYSRFLAIGNPDDPQSEFYEVCKPGSGWNVIKIAATDSPNFTTEPASEIMRSNLISMEWVEEKRRRWGEDNPLYISKVLAEFPEISKDGLIPITWIKRAHNRELKPSKPNELGVDIGGGSNRSVIAHRQGPVVRIIHRDQNPDTTITTGHIVKAIRSTQATRCKIDMQGIGQPIYDQLVLMRRIEKDKATRRESCDTALLNCEIIGVRVGLPAEDNEQFFDIRAEGYWSLRERMQDGAISLDETGSRDLTNNVQIPLDDLMAQLCDLKQVPTPRGQIRIQSKKEKDPEKWASTDSPDDADAVMLAFLKVPRGGKWGVVGQKK